MTGRRARIALIGTGKMARAHSQAYLTAARFLAPPIEPELAVLCGRTPERARATAAAFGWAEVADWREAVRRPDIDVVDVCAATGAHVEMACAAAATGKAVVCEKPLASDLAGAEAMAEAVARAGVASTVVFNYRSVPAIRMARDLISAGELGAIRHFDVRFLQDWLTDPARPMSWRLRRDEGGGVLGDLGSHLVDLVHHLVGPVTRVAAVTAQHVTERTDEGGAAHAVDVEDAAQALLVAGGVPGTLSVSRVATGHRCANEVEIIGERGSVRWSFQSLNDLHVYLPDGPAGVRGWRMVSVTQPGVHPWADAWWGTGHGLGFEETFCHHVAGFLRRLAGEPAGVPTFEDGLRCQRVLAAIERAAASERWETV